MVYDVQDEIYSSETLHTQDNILGGKYNKEQRKNKRESKRKGIFHTALEMMDAVSHWITEMKKISR